MPERELRGYADALETVYRHAAEMPLPAENLLALHRTMLAPAGDRLAGAYKDEDNVILPFAEHSMMMLFLCEKELEKELKML